MSGGETLRLWHQNLIEKLPRPQLLGQHRECCALRGGGWMKSHATVNYVFQHPIEHLFQYHLLVMQEMRKRGYHVNPLWWDPNYRGKKMPSITIDKRHFASSHPIYSEHDQSYLNDCLDNLRQKGVEIAN